MEFRIDGEIIKIAAIRAEAMRLGAHCEFRDWWLLPLGKVQEFAEFLAKRPAPMTSGYGKGVLAGLRNEIIPGCYGWVRVGNDAGLLAFEMIEEQGGAK